jgi:hypothetical protein
MWWRQVRVLCKYLQCHTDKLEPVRMCARVLCSSGRKNQIFVRVGIVPAFSRSFAFHAVQRLFNNNSETEYRRMQWYCANRGREFAYSARSMYRDIICLFCRIQNMRIPFSSIYGRKGYFTSNTRTRCP